MAICYVEFDIVTYVCLRGGMEKGNKGGRDALGFVLSFNFVEFMQS